MPKTFNPDEYKIENKNEDSLFKNFRDELVLDLEGGFSAISTDLANLYSQIEGAPEVTIESIGAAAEDHDHDDMYATKKHGHSFDELSDVPTEFEPAQHQHSVSDIVDLDADSVGAIAVPKNVADENAGVIAFSPADNTEYRYSGVTGLTITLNNNSAHGFFVFGDNITAPSYINKDQFFVAGDDITAAETGERWEFDTLEGCAFWRNWGATTI